MKSKAALIDRLSILLEKREIKLPRVEVWPEGVDELEAFEFTVSETGNTRTGAPYGYHDDCVIALALAAWHASVGPVQCQIAIGWGPNERLGSRVWLEF